VSDRRPHPTAGQRGR